MKVLIITNLYPPHHAGTYDLRCQSVAQGLRARGHDIHILTSNHGVTSEQRDGEIDRRLRLNGVYGHPAVVDFMPLRQLEEAQHRILNEAIESFSPELIYVWSLQGISKSLIFGLHRHNLPVVYDVADYWISNELRTDPWLDWWNRPKLPMGANMMRTSLEISGQRKKIDEVAPTRDSEETKRLSHIYEEENRRTDVVPNTINTFRFDRIYFASRAVRDSAIQVGYLVDHGVLIHPGVPVAHFRGEVKESITGPLKLLVTTRLHRECGVDCVLEALKILKQTNIPVQLTIAARGDSEMTAKLRSQTIRFELPVEFAPVSDLTRGMPAVYRQHDVLIHPPEWPEPYALNQLEAMAAGLLVISSGAGGAGDPLQHGVNALLYTPGSADELAAHIASVHQKPDLRKQIARMGQATVLQYYDEKTVLDRVEEYLKGSLPA